MPDTNAYALVWIDRHEALILVRQGTDIVFERMESDVPDHHRSTGHVRHDPRVRHGGGGGAPQDAGESQRHEHYVRFLRLVADRLPVAANLTILGPGTTRGHLEHEIRESDRHHRRERVVIGATAQRLTNRQLVARLDHDAGVGGRRRTVGAYRWSGTTATTRSGHPIGLPRRVTRKTAEPSEPEGIEV